MRLHVLDSQGGSAYRCAVHFQPPAGTNSANFTWKDVFLAAGVSGRTVLTEGSGAGQISAAEKVQVTAGDVVELVDSFDIEPPSRLGGDVTARIQEFTDRLREQYKHYGRTVA